MNVYFKLLRAGAREPEYKTPEAAGADLYLPETIQIQAREVRLFPLGVAVQIPEGCEGQIRPRSGMALKKLISILGTIDSDYRGEIGVILWNASDHTQKVEAGTRIAQLVIAPVVRGVFIGPMQALGTTARGAGGFGSTGDQ